MEYTEEEARHWVLRRERTILVDTIKELKRYLNDVGAWDKCRKPYQVEAEVFIALVDAYVSVLDRHKARIEAIIYENV